MTSATTRPVARGGRIELAIGGMTCASCAARIERKLNRLDGVTATVNYATEKAKVAYAPASAPRISSPRSRRPGTPRSYRGAAEPPTDGAARPDDGPAAAAADRLASCSPCRWSRWR